MAEPASTLHQRAPTTTTTKPATEDISTRIPITHILLLSLLSVFFGLWYNNNSIMATLDAYTGPLTLRDEMIGYGACKLDQKSCGVEMADEITAVLCRPDPHHRSISTTPEEEKVHTRLETHILLWQMNDNPTSSSKTAMSADQTTRHTSHFIPATSLADIGSELDRVFTDVLLVTSGNAHQAAFIVRPNKMGRRTLIVLPRWAVSELAQFLTTRFMDSEFASKDYSRPHGLIVQVQEVTRVTRMDLGHLEEMRKFVKESCHAFFRSLPRAWVCYVRSAWRAMDVVVAELTATVPASS
ncbi:hypothetical protein DFS34DRAFT_635472 [Phlyctochytrium arcticum]|nr:hypothetical protein DFS34DRAFT_635472 [Phlyctochytrium arcticum]